MSDSTGNNNSLISISEVARLLGIRANVIYQHVERGTIEAVDDKISKDTYDKIREQQSKYVGIRAFEKSHNNERFDSRYSKHRNKYIDFLETNDYFGISIIDPENILYESPGKEDFYINKEDVALLDYKSESFFRDYGLTEKEKIKRIVVHSKKHPLSKKYIMMFLDKINSDTSSYTPALTEFVRVIFDLPDLSQITDEDIVAVIEDAETVRTKTYLKDFCNYASRYEIVKFHYVELKRKQYNSTTAYSYEEYVRLAKILFNEKYDKNNELTAKALDNHVYAEMWLYLSVHYICAWRSADICNKWIYPNLKSNDNQFKINVDTLKDDIISNNIPANVYEKVALYSIRRIELSNTPAGKTGIGKLRSEIVPALRQLFGKLILIAEYHHISSGEGYMNSHRTAMYRNWVVCKEFFGTEMYDITGRHSLSSIRLNKSYLQGIERATRDNGHPTLIAHVIASFARNHASIDTTAIYLKDHGLTGETAEVVLFMMLQRGVFSVSLYSALCAAYPDQFQKLSISEQTAIMKQIPLSAYELESIGTAIVASDEVVHSFKKADTKEPTEILKAMYAITQGNGKAKDPGIFCMKKALGFSCVNPTYESCLANVCPYHIFTSEGIPALIRVIKEYQEKALRTGNKKYEAVLKKKIIPEFQNIINEIIKEMSDADKKGLQQLITEGLNG